MCITDAQAAGIGSIDRLRVANAEVDDNAPVYSSVEDAVKAAFSESSPLTIKSKHEYGGMVLRKGDGYVYTKPVTSEDPYKVKYHLKIPQGYEKAALYHTHPKGHDSRKFSKDDFDTVRHMNLPSFMADMDTLRIRRLRPEHLTVNMAEELSDVPIK